MTKIVNCLCLIFPFESHKQTTVYKFDFKIEISVKNPISNLLEQIHNNCGLEQVIDLDRNLFFYISLTIWHIQRVINCKNIEHFKLQQLELFSRCNKLLHSLFLTYLFKCCIVFSFFLKFWMSLKSCSIHIKFGYSWNLVNLWQDLFKWVLRWL